MTITISLNGESRTLDEGTTAAALLDALGYTGKRVAVERNGDIVPKSTHGTVTLVNGDSLEVVVAVGGG